MHSRLQAQSATRIAYICTISPDIELVDQTWSGSIKCGGRVDTVFDFKDRIYRIDALQHLLGFELEAAPAVPARDGGVGLPELFEFSELRRLRRQGAFAVEAFDGGLNAKVAAWKDIETAKGKDEEHLRGPDADTFDEGELFDDLLVFQAGDAGEIDGAIGDFVGDIAEVANLLRRKSGGAQFFRGESFQGGKQSIFAAGDVDEAFVNGAGRAGGDLLRDDRADERVKNIGLGLESEGADAIDDRRQDRVALAEILDGRGAVLRGRRRHLSLRISGQSASRSGSLNPMVLIFFALPRFTAACNQDLACSN